MCYMEQQRYIGTISCPDVEPESEMCINTEWGAFGDNSNALDDVKTPFDLEIDAESPNQGQHM